MRFFMPLMIVLLNFPIPVFVAVMGSQSRDLQRRLTKSRKENRQLKKSLGEAMERRDYEPSILTDIAYKENSREANWSAWLSYLCASLLWILGLYLAFTYPY